MLLPEYRRGDLGNPGEGRSGNDGKADRPGIGYRAGGRRKKIVGWREATSFTGVSICYRDQ